jgi:hypothetical protein
LLDFVELIYFCNSIYLVFRFSSLIGWMLLNLFNFATLFTVLLRLDSLVGWILLNLFSSTTLFTVFLCLRCCWLNLVEFIKFCNTLYICPLFAFALFVEFYLHLNQFYIALSVLSPLWICFPESSTRSTFNTEEAQNSVFKEFYWISISHEDGDIWRQRDCIWHNYYYLLQLWRALSVHCVTVILRRLFITRLLKLKNVKLSL